MADQRSTSVQNEKITGYTSNVAVMLTDQVFNNTSVRNKLETFIRTVCVFESKLLKGLVKQFFVGAIGGNVLSGP